MPLSPQDFTAKPGANALLKSPPDVDRTPGNQPRVNLILTEGPPVRHAAGASQPYAAVQANSLIVCNSNFRLVSMGA